MIKYRNVTRSIPEKYENLMPDRISYKLRSDRFRVIEATEDKGPVLGVTVYTFSEGKAELIWINVLPAERGKGIGSGMMNELFRVLEGFEEITAKLIVTDESLKLQAFLSACRFRFQKEVCYELSRKLGAIKTKHRLKAKAMAPGCESMKDMGSEEFRRMLDEMLPGEDHERYDSEELDLSISCIHRNKAGKINGVILINRYGDSTLEPVLLHENDEDENIGLMLIQSCLFLAYGSLDDDVSVYINCKDAHTGMLIDTLLTDVHPVKMMRGICRGLKEGNSFGQ